MSNASPLIDCRLPARKEVFRVKRGAERFTATGAVRNPDTGELYLVAQELWPLVGRRIEWICPRVCINLAGKMFVWPIPVPGPGRGAGPDHRRMVVGAVLDLAEMRWIRVAIDQEQEEYHVAVFEGLNLHEPKWPPGDFYEHLSGAFRGRVVLHPDHPLIQKWGR